MSNQPYHWWQDSISLAMTQRKSAHQYLAWANEYKVKGDKVRFHQNMSKFYDSIKSARWNIRFGRREQLNEVQYMEAAE